MREKEYNWREDRWLHKMLYDMNRARARNFDSCIFWGKNGDRKLALHRAKYYAWCQEKYEYYRNRLEELQRTK